jgi:hypothetical protein
MRHSLAARCRVIKQTQTAQWSLAFAAGDHALDAGGLWFARPRACSIGSGGAKMTWPRIFASNAGLL